MVPPDPDGGDNDGVQVDVAVDWAVRSAASYAAFWEYPARAMGKAWTRWDDVWAVDPQSEVPIPNSATLLRRLDASRVDELVARLGGFYGERPGAP